MRRIITSLDRLAIGTVFVVGKDRYRKVSPHFAKHTETGELLRDARLDLPPNQRREEQAPIVTAEIGD